MQQHEGESISPYVAELMRLSEHCDFGQGLNDVLRDRLVCRLLNKGIQKKLLTEEKIKRAFGGTVSMETAARDTVELQSGVKTTANVNKITAVTKQKGKGQNELCYRCGRGSHTPAECSFGNEKCNKCNKVGRIRRARRSGKFKVNTAEKRSHRDTKKATCMQRQSKINNTKSKGICIW